MEVRVCRHCGVEKEYSAIYFRPSERVCRICRGLKNRANQKAKPFPTPPEGSVRTCGKCEETKLLTRANFRLVSGYFRRDCRGCTVGTAKGKRGREAKRRQRKAYKAKDPVRFRNQKQNGLSYVRRGMAKTMNGVLPADIPKGLVEAKLLQLQINRLLKG